jgi:hypothetical protein
MRIARLALVATVMTAWLVTFNHCAIAFLVEPAVKVAVTSDGMPAHCPMHGTTKTQTPSKQKDCGYLPCCKNLRATQAAPSNLVERPLWLGLFVQFFAPNFDVNECDAALLAFFSDTGPPGQSSFAETVLQRSLLAHAPPVSLS